MYIHIKIYMLNVHGYDISQTKNFLLNINTVYNVNITWKIIAHKYLIFNKYKNILKFNLNLQR